MPDVHIEGGGKVQYSYSFLRQNGRYTTPETALCCCYGPPRGLPATIGYTPVYQRSDEVEEGQEHVASGTTIIGLNKRANGPVNGHLTISQV